MIFSLTPPATPGAAWKEAALHVFSHRVGGITPNYPLSLEANGTLYGTTRYGGVLHGRGNGTLFALTPASGGTYQHTVLYTFSQPLGGQQPGSGVIIDNGGNLYGVATYGGYSGNGVVYRVNK